jgi:protein-S-isoprenylcysteine O-methyltransferase Ste14
MLALLFVSNFACAAGHAVFRCRDALAPVAVVLFALVTRRADFLAPTSVDYWLDGVGIGVVIVGLGMRLLVIAGSGIRRSGVRKRVIAPTLFETGPYAWCRNPLYVGNAVILIGLTLIFDSRWMVGIGLPVALLAIRSIVAAEERVLTKSFGARYHDYCRRVPRFLPHRPFARVAAPPLDWHRAVRKEHGTIFAAITTAVVLMAAEDLVREGSTGWHWHVPALLCAWLVMASLWARVRYLKHTGRLHDPPASPRMPTPAPAIPVGDIAA